MNEPLLLDPASVASDLLAAPATPETPQPPASTPPPAVRVPIRDARVFNPEIFKSHADGAPVTNKFGFYMPIGGSKKRSNGTPSPNQAPQTQENATQGPTAPPSPEKSAWGEAERAGAAGTVPPLDPKQAAGTGEPLPASGPSLVDVSEDAAEVGTRTLYFTVGALIGSMEEATPDKLDHDNLRQAAAAYLRTTGWKGTALTCMVLRICAYLLKTFHKPRASEQVKKWLADFKAKKKAEPRPVEPVAPTAGQRAQNAPVSIMPRFTERAAG